MRIWVKRLTLAMLLGVGVYVLVKMMLVLISPFANMAGRHSRSLDITLHHAIERALYLPENRWGEYAFYLNEERAENASWCSVDEFLKVQSLDIYTKCRRSPKYSLECSLLKVYWLRPENCRIASFPLSYWENPDIKLKMINAIKNPCLYIAGKQPLGSRVTPYGHLKSESYPRTQIIRLNCDGSATNESERVIVLLFNDETHEIVKKEEITRTL